MPGPSSSTVTTAVPGSLLLSITTTRVPGGVCTRLLASRLANTWCRRLASPVTVTGSVGSFSS